MPQINQLSEIFVSQLFWLAVVFGIIYFVIGRGMVPKIRGTVGARDSQIAADLERAQAAREQADKTEADWRTRMDAARAEAGRVAQEAKQASAMETETRVKAAAESVARKVEAAEGQIRTAVIAARAEIESVAADAAREMVGRLTGIAIDSNEAAMAVRTELNG
ncbi:ATPase [Sphingomonas sp.]|uniref:F0F1 ATP synthase subunit B family protein n=1 Tax=Sphingomonas sp. TaxID=28214 RepID=UPI0025D95D97|nr:ATPase [Sphingomonas sp.]MBV9528254.1 ATPase [Sphingomonas sp.]